jgi:hypothetical protein
MPNSAAELFYLSHEILNVRDSLINKINGEFDRLIAMLDMADAPAVLDRTIPLTADPILFKRKKPIAILFGREQVIASTWKMAYGLILSRCNQDPQCHDWLMSLRDEVGGAVRVFLTDSPGKLRNAVRIDEELYAETAYCVQTLMHILTSRILSPVRYDYSNISIIVREPNKAVQIAERKGGGGHE